MLLSPGEGQTMWPTRVVLPGASVRTAGVEGRQQRVTQLTGYA